jgi:putative DNA primase/helicase
MKLAILEFHKQATEAGHRAAEAFARKSLDERRIAAALAMARSELPILPLELDREPYLLNFKNGTLDLRTCELLPHSREHYITKLIHFNYSLESKAPVFESFSRADYGRRSGPCSEGRAHRLIDHLQRSFGHSLTGVTSEKTVFILWGGGDNGKTTLLELFRFLLSEYSAALQIDTLMSRSRETNNSQSDLADLRGARFVTASETEQEQHLSEGKTEANHLGNRKNKGCSGIRKSHSVRREQPAAGFFRV